MCKITWINLIWVAYELYFFAKSCDNVSTCLLLNKKWATHNFTNDSE